MPYRLPLGARLGLLALAAAALVGADTPATTTPKPLIRDFMGINFHTFQVVDPSLHGQTTKLARDYHPAAWDIDSKGGEEPIFPMTREGIRDHKPIDWTEVYGAWRKGGYAHIDACLTAFDWTRDHGWFPDMPTDVERYGKAFAAFFGPSGAHPLVDSAEIENEPTKFTDEQYVELLKSLGKGLRAGDPKLKIVTCTMSALKPDQWEKPIQCTEGLEDLFDVINLHTYSLKAGWPSFERSFPEDPGIRYLTTIDAMVDYRNQHPALKAKEIWVTEFGYDCASPEALKTSDPKWVCSTPTQQAQWLVRSFLVFANKDVQRAYLYFWDDPDGNGFHGASGITRKNQPKPSFYAVRHLQNALGAYRLKRVVQQDAQAYVYEFADDAGQLAWAAWSPTSGQPDAERVIAGAPRKPSRCERLLLADGKAVSEKADVGPKGLKVKLGESPLFIFFDKH